MIETLHSSGARPPRCSFLVRTLSSGMPDDSSDSFDAEDAPFADATFGGVTEVEADNSGR